MKNFFARVSFFIVAVTLVSAPVVSIAQFDASQYGTEIGDAINVNPGQDGTEMDGGPNDGDTGNTSLDPYEVDGSSTSMGGSPDLATKLASLKGGVAANCSSASYVSISNSLNSFINSIAGQAASSLSSSGNGAASNITNSVIKSGTGAAANQVTNVANSAAGQVTGTLNQGLGQLRSTVLSGVDSIVKSGATLASDGIFKLAEMTGSQTIADLANNTGLSSLAGEGLSSLGGLGGVSDMFSSFSGGSAGGGGGGPIPTADKLVGQTTSALKMKETCADQLATLASRQALAKMDAAAFKFANEGFAGNPLFGNSINTYLDRVSKDTTSLFFDNLSTSDSPLGRQLLPTLAAQERARNDTLFKTSYTLDKVAGSQANADRFVSGDMTACTGVLRCLSALADADNNVYGLYGKVEQELSEERSNAVAKASAQIVNGVLPKEECLDPVGPFPLPNNQPCKERVVVTGASSIDSIINSAVNSPRKINEGAITDGIDKVAYAYQQASASVLSKGVTSANNDGLDAYIKSDQQSIAKGIDVAIGTLQNYLDMMERIASALGDIVGTLDSLNSCYSELNTLLSQRSLSAETNPLQSEVDRKGEYSDLRNNVADEIIRTSSLSASFDSIKEKMAGTMETDEFSQSLSEYQSYISLMPTNNALTAAASQLGQFLSNNQSWNDTLKSCRQEMDQVKNSPI